jgi:hypothetical protein
MMPLNLMDNPLFLRNYRERLRWHSLLSGLVVTGFIMALIFLYNYHSAETLSLYDFSAKASVRISWMRHIIYQVSSLQGAIILLFGTLSVYRSAAQERLGGTLEFHRASPVRGIDQAIGLVLGGAILEWVLFVFSLAVVLGLAFVDGVPGQVIIKFYAAFFLTAFLLHTFAAWFGLFASQQKFKGGFIGGLFMLYVLSTLSIGLAMASSSMSALYHATWLPAYEAFKFSLLGVRENSWRFAVSPDHVPLGAVFYGIKMPAILLQVLVQVPAGVLAVVGIHRRFASGEKSFLSKTQFMALTILVMFYYLGSIMGAVSERFFQGVFNFVTIYLVYGLMVLGAFAATPGYLSYRKGLARARRMGQAGPGLSEDDNTNSLWLFVFCMTSVFFFSLYAFIARLPSTSTVLVLTVMMLHAVGFSGALEAFRLGRWHTSKAYFWTIVSLLWAGLPILGMVTTVRMGASQNEHLSFFFALSPLFNGGILGELLGQDIRLGTALVKMDVLLGINLIFAVTATFLAWKQRQHIRREVLGSK